MNSVLVISRNQVIGELPSEFSVDGYYVTDALALSVQKAYVSGPFDSAEIAEKDRIEWNCSEDCQVVKFVTRKGI